MRQVLCCDLCNVLQHALQGMQTTFGSFWLPVRRSTEQKLSYLLELIGPASTIPPSESVQQATVPPEELGGLW